MIYWLIPHVNMKETIILSFIITFISTLFSLKHFKNYLPQDLGRAFAVNGRQSKGKPRGAGIILIFVFAFMVIFFVPLSAELIIYVMLISASMLSGFLDDGAKKPWTDYTKGSIDLVIAIVTSITYTKFNPNFLSIQILNNNLSLQYFLSISLMTILIWLSINVTNCSDGVDGLCGSLSIVSLITVYFIMNSQYQSNAHIILLMISCILGYLWFNISPSGLLMGDACFWQDRIHAFRNLIFQAPHTHYWDLMVE